jgi:hypothetical protein
MIALSRFRFFGFIFMQAFSGTPVFASDFACLKALIPATTSYKVNVERGQFGVPLFSEPGTAVAITQWDHHRLISVFVYNDRTAHRFDRLKRGEMEVALASMDLDWLKDHYLVTKMADLEVFRFFAAEPTKPTHGATPPKVVGEEGGWLIEAASQQTAGEPLRKEIALRQAWARAHNLDSSRFKAWSLADKECGQQKPAPSDDGED